MVQELAFEVVPHLGLVHCNIILASGTNISRLTGHLLCSLPDRFIAKSVMVNIILDSNMKARKHLLFGWGFILE